LKLGGSRVVNALLREISIGLTKEELMYMYNDATKEKFNCLIVNLEKSGNERYRKNFLDYYTIE
jgi:predicted metalloprotease